METAELIAVADNSKRALAQASAMGIKRVYANYEEPLDDKSADAVIIAIDHLGYALGALVVELSAWKWDHRVSCPHHRHDKETPRTDE